MMGLREYARHRASKGLPGGTLRAVQVAIESGRLQASITPEKKIRDADEADAEWAAATASDHVPLTGPTAPAGDPDRASTNDLVEARARREAAQASIREMELAQRRGELVPAKAIEDHLANVFARCRTKLLGVSARARQRDPSLSAQQLVLIEGLIREALEDLASPTALDD